MFFSFVDNYFRATKIEIVLGIFALIIALILVVLHKKGASKPSDFNVEWSPSFLQTCSSAYRMMVLWLCCKRQTILHRLISKSLDPRPVDSYWRLFAAQHREPFSQ